MLYSMLTNVGLWPPYPGPEGNYRVCGREKRIKQRIVNAAAGNHRCPQLESPFESAQAIAGIRAHRVVSPIFSGMPKSESLDSRVL